MSLQRQCTVLHPGGGQPGPAWPGLATWAGLCTRSTLPCYLSDPSSLQGGGCVGTFPPRSCLPARVDGARARVDHVCVRVRGNGDSSSALPGHRPHPTESVPDWVTWEAVDDAGGVRAASHVFEVCLWGWPSSRPSVRGPERPVDWQSPPPSSGALLPPPSPSRTGKPTHHRPHSLRAPDPSTQRCASWQGKEERIGPFAPTLRPGSRSLPLPHPPTERPQWARGGSPPWPRRPPTPPEDYPHRPTWRLRAGTARCWSSRPSAVRA